MAGASLLALIDDIASVLDDVALMTKVAAKKTAGVLGDDLALNAQQVSGVRAERELPVVWAVAVGSLKNKLILVPAALAISRFIPWAVTPLLMLGGLYLCLEGVEKLAHRWLHKAGDDDPGTPSNWLPRWPTKRSTWQHSRPTRSRAPSGPTSFSRPKLSSSPSAPSPTSLSPPRSRCCRGSA
jgi:predicted DNA repair protein MutK